MARQKTYTTTIGAALDDGVGEADRIKDELQEWYDNLPESFQNGEKGDRLAEAMDALDALANMDASELPEAMRDAPVEVPAFKGKHSRRADRDHACACARAAVDAARAWIDEQVAALEEGAEDDENTPNFDGDISLLDDYESALDDAEGADFPGMYG